MIRMTDLTSGSKCIKVECRDSDNEIRIHLHANQMVDIKDTATLEGILILSRKGTLYERGKVGECG